MRHALTADGLFKDLKAMPAAERQRFFVLLSETAFRAEDMTHEQLFGSLQNEKFTSQEAAEYLEVSLPTLRRYVASEKLAVDSVVGRNQFFAVPVLKAFKRALQATKNKQREG